MGQGFESLLAYQLSQGVMVSAILRVNVVGVVQLAEHWIVVPGVVGSSPITHPRQWQGIGAAPIPCFFPRLGRRQVVRQGTLTPSPAGSNPAVPAISFPELAQGILTR